MNVRILIYADEMLICGLYRLAGAQAPLDRVAADYRPIKQLSCHRQPALQLSVLSGMGQTILCTKRCRCQKTKSIDLLHDKKYVRWNVYLRNVVVFHTPLSKYLTVIVMTLNYTVSQKGPTCKLSVTLSNLNRFSKCLHCWKAYKIRYKTDTKLPTSPQVCRYTTLRNQKFKFSADIQQIWKKI